jgi:hypothetical protein
MRRPSHRSLVSRVVGDAFLTPGLGVRLEETDRQLARVFFAAGPRVARKQHRQVARQPIDGFSHGIECLAACRGRVTPVFAARSRDHMPPQITTVLARIRPLSVITPAAAFPGG